jgi:tetratricopeptide (TPR) repeat protein
MILATSYLDAGLPHHALTVSELRDQDAKPAAWQIRHDALLGLGRWEEASVAAAKALELDTTCTPALYRVILARCRAGNALGTEGRTTAALLERLAQRAPHGSATYHCRAFFLLARGDGPEAEACAAAFCTRYPSLAFAHRSQAEILFRRGHLRAAVDVIRKALELDPTARETLLLGQQLLAASAEERRLRELTEAALQQFPNDWPVVSRSAELFARLGAGSTAASLSSHALELEPASGSAWYHHAKVLWHLRRPGEALECCRKALGALPDSAHDLRTRLARLQASCRHLAKP